MIRQLSDLIDPSAMTSFKRGLKLVGYGLLLALLIGTHTAAYMEGRADKAAEYAEQTIEQLETDIVDNAERIERQVTTVTRATARFEEQADKLQEAINENQSANLDPNCSLSPDEFRLFNESISETERGVSGDSLGALLSAKAAKQSKSGGTEDQGE